MRRAFSVLSIFFGIILLTTTEADSTAPAPAPAASQDGISMIIASDTQFNWWREGQDPDCTNSGDCKSRKAKQTNENTVSAMNHIMSLGQWPASLKMGAGANIVEPSGIIINGDLTAYWQRDEAHLFMDHYNRDDLKYTLYPGLGNHDYSNNAGDDTCYYLPLYYPDAKRCAKQAVWYMANTIQDLPAIVNRDLSGFVAVVGKGAFSTRFKVTYKENGKEVEKNSGSFPVLQTKKILIPKGSTDIKLTIEGNTGNIFQGDDGWIKVDTYRFSGPVAACYRTTGTAQDQDSDDIPCPDEWPSGSKGSLSYSFDIGNFHFVQLHNRPNYAVNLPKVTTIHDVIQDIYELGVYGAHESPSFSVTQSYAWLKADLAAATKDNKYIVINMHDATDNFDVRSNESFTDAIANQNVVAIFAGHLHQKYGQSGDTINNGVYEIPLLLSGSVECERFLFAEFHRKYFNVGVVKSAGGSPAFVTAAGDVCDSRQIKNDDGNVWMYAFNSANTAPQTFTINRPPTVTGSLLTSPALEGSSLAFSAAGADPDGDALTYAWSFGDGGSSTGQSPTHTYNDNGSYTVSVTADDSYERGQTTYTFQVTVNNVAPTITASGLNILENGVETVNGVITDPGVNDSFSLVVNWGEGSPQTINLPAGTTVYNITHRYLDDNPTGTSSDVYPIRIDVRDKDNGAGAANTSISVGNVNPVVRIDRVVDQGGQEVTVTDIALVGLPLTSYESYTDVGTQDTRTATRNWGDASIENLGTVTAATTGSHTYNQAATYNLLLSVKDDDTGTGTATRPIQVVTPAAAMSRMVSDLSRLTSTKPAAKTALNAAVADLQGNNGGKAHDGALDKLAQGARPATLVKLEQAIGHLEAAEKSDPALQLTKYKSLLALTAKSIVVDSVARAEAVASNAGQRKQVASAKSLLASGQLLLDRRAFTAAVKEFRGALSKTQFAGHTSMLVGGQELLAARIAKLHRLVPFFRWEDMFT